MTMEKLSKMSMNRILDYINSLEKTQRSESHKERKRVISLEDDRRRYPNNCPKPGKCGRGITYDVSNGRFIVYYEHFAEDSATGHRKWNHVYVGSAYTLGDALEIQRSCKIPEAHTWWNQKPF